MRFRGDEGHDMKPRNGKIVVRESIEHLASEANHCDTQKRELVYAYFPLLPHRLNLPQQIHRIG
jgi:hypothetical protein